MTSPSQRLHRFGDEMLGPRTRGLAAVAAVAAAGACARAPRSLPPEPVDAASAALGIAVSVHWPDGERSAPDIVYFVRTDAGAAEARALEAQELVASNHADGERFFVLNAPPGTYFAVAAAKVRAVPGLGGRVSPGSSRDTLATRLAIDIGARRKRTHRVYLDATAIGRTRTGVAAGDCAFLGSVTASAGAWTAAAGGAQQHFYRQLQGDPGLRVGASAAAPAWLGRIETLRRETAHESEFLRAAQATFARSRWSEHIARRLDALR